jgi:hypothetical protein
MQPRVAWSPIRYLSCVVAEVQTLDLKALERLLVHNSKPSISIMIHLTTIVMGENAIP